MTREAGGTDGEGSGRGRAGGESRNPKPEIRTKAGSRKSQKSDGPGEKAGLTQDLGGTGRIDFLSCMSIRVPFAVPFETTRSIRCFFSSSLLSFVLFVSSWPNHRFPITFRFIAVANPTLIHTISG